MDFEIIWMFIFKISLNKIILPKQSFPRTKPSTQPQLLPDYKVYFAIATTPAYLQFRSYRPSDKKRFSARRRGRLRCQKSAVAPHNNGGRGRVPHRGGLHTPAHPIRM